jgi:hypothetical protein
MIFYVNCEWFLPTHDFQISSKALSYTLFRVLVNLVS